MKRFVFSMQALYDVQKAKEKQVLADFAQAQEKVRTLEEQIYNHQTKMKAEHVKFHKQSQCGMSVTAFQNACAYLSGIRQRIDSLKNEAEQARSAVRKIQQQLRTIYQEKKALERLRDKQYQVFHAEQVAEEAKETEDLLVGRMLNNMIHQGRAV